MNSFHCLAFFVSCCLMLALQVQFIQGSSVQQCALFRSRERAMAITKFQTKPDPIVLRHNRDLSYNVSINVYKPIRQSALLAVEVHKVQPNLFPIRLPCIRGVGSCTRSFARMRSNRPLSLFFDAIEFNFVNGTVPIGQYNAIDHQISVWAPRNSSEERLIRFLGSGTYTMRIRVLERFAVIACSLIRFRIQI